MMKVLLPFFLVISFFLTACNSNTPESKNIETKQAKPRLSIAMLSIPHDYVCGMDLDRDEFVADTTLYNGKVYGFCAPECKQEFIKNPQQFLYQN
jgi:YHS domain-containing protein